MKPVSPLLISRSRARLFKSFVLAAGNETSFDQDSVRHVAKRYWFVQVWQGSWGDCFVGIFFGVVFAISWFHRSKASKFILWKRFDSLWNSLLEFRSLWWFGGCLVVLLVEEFLFGRWNFIFYYFKKIFTIS